VTNPNGDEGKKTLKAILRYGFNPLALGLDGDTALHCVASCAVASHLVDRDYWLAREGRQFDPTVARKLLCTRNRLGQDALTAAHARLQRLDCNDEPGDPQYDSAIVVPEMNNVIGYLESWSSSRSFVPDVQELDHNLSVMPNPDLGDFQRFLVGSVYRHLEQNAIGEVACVVLGYLAPLDLLSGWEQWDHVSAANLLSSREED
jgi:hypothetical protein